MNFKKSCMRENGGFTLVELIVVIAILAILAGIAVPAYSGYIKKANKAADLQLLGAVNTAFAAAVLDADNASISSEPDGKYGFNVNTMRPTGVSEDCLNAYETYFGGNTAKFKVITGLQFKGGAFVEIGEGGSGNMTAAQVQAAVKRWEGSNMAGKEDKLVASVGTLSNALAGEVGSLDFDYWLGEEGYKAFKEEYGITDETSDTEVANALIMYTAAATEGKTAKDILDLAGEDLSNIGKITETYGSIPTAAMLYGVITGYTNSGKANDTVMNAYNQGVTGVGDVFTLLDVVGNDPNFMEYVQNKEGKGMTADLDGYLAAMEIVNGHSGSFDLTKSDAFTNQETLDLMNSILGK